MVEGKPPEICRGYIEEKLGQGEAGGNRRSPFAFGQYSDDTQLARELMQSYVARGRSTEEAARRLALGVPWDEAGTPPPSAGNGSAMRAGPIGLLYHDDPEGLIQAATDQGIITHADPRCSAGAIAIAGAVALSLRGRPVKPAPFLAYLAELVEKVESRFAAFLMRLERCLPLPPEEAVTRISEEGLESEPAHKWRGISPFVVGSVLWSLYSFLRSPEDYRETIRTAIAVGGDVDTTGAMAGTISGARLGLDAVPPNLSRCLTDRGTGGLVELTELADECYERKCGGSRL